MLDGLKITLSVFGITLLLSMPLGIGIAFMRLSKIKIISEIAKLYILVMRGTPLLLQIIVVFFGLPIIGIVFDRFPTVIIALTLNYAAYSAEIFRAGIQSIDKGQYEASMVLGYSKAKMYKQIIFPQVIKRILPPISNEVISLVKDTSLVYIVGLDDILRISQIASNEQASLTPLLFVGAIYLALTIILTFVFRKLENKYAYYM